MKAPNLDLYFTCNLLIRYWFVNDLYYVCCSFWEILRQHLEIHHKTVRKSYQISYYVLFSD